MEECGNKHIAFESGAVVVECRLVEQAGRGRQDFDVGKGGGGRGERK